MTPVTVEMVWQSLTTQLDEAGLFYGHGAINAESEALWIISKVLNFPPEDTAESLEETISEEELQQIQLFAQKRITTRKPLAYILEEAWLMGVPFFCDERSIVPRSFIAELIASGELNDFLPPNANVLDLCTGNGSLAVLMALNYPDIHMTASDISMPALSLAAKNLDRHILSEQIELVQSDLFESIELASEEDAFDLIICNPPYVNEMALSNLPLEYRAEPALALDGGSDGMRLIRRILYGATAYLKPTGVLILEIGNEKKYFKQAFPGLPVTWLEVSSGTDQVLKIEAKDLHLI